MLFALEQKSQDQYHHLLLFVFSFLLFSSRFDLLPFVIANNKHKLVEYLTFLFVYLIEKDILHCSCRSMLLPAELVLRGLENCLLYVCIFYFIFGKDGGEVRRGPFFFVVEDAGSIPAKRLLFFFKLFFYLTYDETQC